MVKKSFVLIVKCTIKNLIAYNKSREFYKPYYVLSYVERKKKATNCAGIISFLPACF